MNLSMYDYVLLLDRSGSMEEKDCPGGKSRWAYMQETAKGIANAAAKYDDDGITVIPFNSNFKKYDNCDASAIDKIYSECSPMGSTDTARALSSVLDDYFNRKLRGSVKPLIVLVFTDGVPDSQSEVARVIINAANKIEKDEEIGISFLQVGYDKQATAFLKKLDDELQGKGGAKFDIVDTKTFDEIADLTPEQIFEGAVND